MHQVQELLLKQAVIFKEWRKLTLSLLHLEESTDQLYPANNFKSYSRKLGHCPMLQKRAPQNLILRKAITKIKG